MTLVHCRQMAMQTQHGQVFEMSREAENPDFFFFYVKFPTFTTFNKQNVLEGRKWTLGHHLLPSVL